uniref:Uncharacterized protein n=1 Tax=Caenorhabditis japonica TaxID=281687 RepID=A0A8R1EC63_CAEJA
MIKAVTTTLPQSFFLSFFLPSIHPSIQPSIHPSFHTSVPLSLPLSFSLSLSVSPILVLSRRFDGLLGPTVLSIHTLRLLICCTIRLIR